MAPIKNLDQLKAISVELPLGETGSLDMVRSEGLLTVAWPTDFGPEAFHASSHRILHVPNHHYVCTVMGQEEDVLGVMAMPDRVEAVWVEDDEQNISVGWQRHHLDDAEFVGAVTGPEDVLEVGRLERLLEATGTAAVRHALEVSIDQIIDFLSADLSAQD